MTGLLRLLPFLLLCLPVLATAQGTTPAREQFKAALATARLGLLVDDSGFSNHPLYTYLQAARLQRALANANGAEVDAQIANFLATAANPLAVRELRKAWLLSLATRGEWGVLLGNDDGRNADTELRCHLITAKLMTEAGDGQRETALARWMTTEELPPACEPMVQWLREQGALTPELIDQRTRLALKANKTRLANKLIPLLPETSAAPFKRWSALLDTPGPQLQKLIAEPGLDVELEALIAGYARLARKDSELAQKLHDPLLKKRHIPKPRQMEFTRELALGLALDRKSEAIKYYREIPESALDERGYEWRVRAAIWNADWKQARAWSGQLPSNLATQARWRYWRARALAAGDKNQREQAATLYAQLASENGYYSVLATQQLGRAYLPTPTTVPDEPAQRVALAHIEPLTRAREAAAIGEYGWAAAEWREGLTRLAPDQQKQAIRLAADWGLYEQAVGTATQFQVFDDFVLLYPRPFLAEVNAASVLAGITPAQIYSVMRQESLFRPDAISSAGALGLLQMLPETARRTASNWNRPIPSSEDLKRPEINIPLGAAHLRELSDAFGGRYIVMLGGYNAGANAVRRWLPEKSAAADIWIENIPYNETRSYVQKILWNITVYGWIASGEPQSIASLLTPVSIELATETAATP